MEFIFLCLPFFVTVFGWIDADPMTDPFPERIIKEVATTGGNPGASSQWSDTWAAPNAFKWDYKYGWSSGKLNGIHLPYPHYIWYSFPQPFLPAEVSFRPRQDGPTYLAPTKWQFVGTNDVTCNQNSAWTLLCEDLSGIPYKKSGETRFCKVKPEIRKKYKCLGIRVMATEGGGETNLNSLRFWEQVETN